MQVVIPYTPHPAQQTLHKDKKRFKVLVCGRRFGKTTYCLNEMLVKAFEKKGNYWYVAPTYKQAKMIAWRLLLDYVPEALRQKINETELTIDLINGSVISLKGADSPDSLRGVKLHGCILDEYADINPELFDLVILPALGDVKGWATFVGTPKGFNHFYNLYNFARKEDEKDWSAYHFTSYDNPHVPVGAIEDAKKKVTSDYFSQEYMADFKKFTGLIFKEFNRDKHVIHIDQPKDEWAHYRAIDFGIRDPNVCLFIGVDEDKTVYIYDEIYMRDLYTSQFADVINAKSGGRYFVSSVGDSAAAQSIRDMEQHGLFIQPVKKNTGEAPKRWLVAGLEKIRQQLKPEHGTPKLFIADHCVHTIREFESYRWKEKSDTALPDINQPEIPEDANNHTVDALRYFYGTFVDIPRRRKTIKRRYSPVTGRVIS